MSSITLLRARRSIISLFALNLPQASNSLLAFVFQILMTKLLHRLCFTNGSLHPLGLLVKQQPLPLSDPPWFPESFRFLRHEMWVLMVWGSPGSEWLRGTEPGGLKAFESDKPGLRFQACRSLCGLLEPHFLNWKMENSADLRRCQSGPVWFL